LLTPSVLGLVPKAAVSGTLIFVGVNGIQSTRLYERCLLVLTDPHFYPKGATPTGVPLEKVFLFTLIQIALVVGCWMCNTYLGLAFPVFVGSLIPIRWRILPLFFAESQLRRLETAQPAASYSRIRK
ncbi:unnamed protein product, partial [Polarella glacialis]